MQTHPPPHGPMVPAQHHPPQLQIQQSGRNGNLLYSLRVEQQPDRARMCGFGDKDRRPITPPPCIKLVVTDVNTGRQLSMTEIESQHFVMNVDLWNADGTHEANLVKSSNSSPSMSISMATTARYPPAPEPAYHMRQPMYGHPGMDPAYYGHMGPNGAVAPGGYYPGPAPIMQSNGAQTSNFTRNLIGSTTVSAAQLNDLDDDPGFWFVLQDLSVRQEGTFRLKMSFIDLSGPVRGELNITRVPVLASVFSEPFTVWSAKRFPGVKESTALSKCFAAQGVKIPIRKDGGKAGGPDDDD
ncbi:hypothetical protein FH972_021225 [Carpinus fangiana]|uniref:Velvet domain-containing protein n=1 Tax=Carpinus fangiana TaxID=176857 RepID=A0A5N6KPB8_9ROSI|nr:hypothetical protein FH972_021225 [Carpinus fangiana]